MSIAVYALREILDEDDEPRDGDYMWTQWVHPAIFSDEPMFSAVKNMIRTEVVERAGEHHGIEVVPGDVEVYSFSPAYLDAAWRRGSTFYQAREMPHMGEIVALWRHKRPEAATVAG